MKWLNIIALTAVIVINALANILPINGMTTGEVAALYPNLFVPAGLTFSIWSLIYILLSGYCLYPFISDNAKHAISISGLFAITCLLNCSWILAWHYLFIEVSVVIMLLLLAALCLIYIRLRKKLPVSKREKWLVYKPFSVYLGWITAATVANITALLVHYEFSPPSPENWTIAMIIALLLIAYLINKKYRDVAYSLVVIWALLGIIIKRTATELVFGPIVITCTIAIVIMLWITIHYRYRKSLT